MVGFIGDADPSPANDHALALCDVLGLDPEEVTAIHVHLEAGQGAVIRWDSCRRIPLDLIADAINTAVAHDNERQARARNATHRAATNTTADPWTSEPPC